MFQRLVDLLKPDVSTEAKLTGITVTVGKEFERLQSQVNTIEIKTLIPLKDGEDGKDGKDGRDGKDGKIGPKGLDGKQGPKGDPGKDGKDGADGKNGVSVVDSEIAADDHLVLKLSNGKIIDVGELPGMSTGRIQQIINTQVSTINNEDALELTSGGVTNLHSHESSGGTEVISGTTTVTFGTGATDAQATIAAPAITGSKVTKAWIFPAATASNTIDNHWVEDLSVAAGNVVAGVGFTVYAKCNTGRAHGIYTIGWEYI